MDDDYQHIIRGPPVDRKPDHVALDAASEAGPQGPRPFQWYDPAIFARAVAQATVGAHLIKEKFDDIIAHSTGTSTSDVDPQGFHVCDPRSYATAINVATFDGSLCKDFFDRVVVSQAVYQVARIEHPPLATRRSIEPLGSMLPRAQVLHAHQPRGDQVSQVPQARSLKTPYSPQIRTQRDQS
jgi:hypothetical protein